MTFPCPLPPLIAKLAGIVTVPRRGRSSPPQLLPHGQPLPPAAAFSTTRGAVSSRRSAPAQTPRRRREAARCSANLRSPANLSPPAHLRSALFSPSPPQILPPPRPALTCGWSARRDSLPRTDPPLFPSGLSLGVQTIIGYSNNKVSARKQGYRGRILTALKYYDAEGTIKKI